MPPSKHYMRSSFKQVVPVSYYNVRYVYFPIKLFFPINTTFRWLLHFQFMTDVTNNTKFRYFAYQYHIIQFILRNKSNDLLTQNQDNVSEWCDMSTHRLLIQ